MKKTLFPFLLMIPIFLISCTKQYTFQYFDTFDTVCEFSGYFSSEEKAKIANDTVNEYLHYYNGLFDAYENDGIIKKINDNAGISPVEVPGDVIELLEGAKEMYGMANGYINIMMGNVTKLWKDAENTKVIPNEKALAEASKHISIDSLIIDKESSTVFITDKEARLDVGAVAKGYVCDKICHELKETGFDGFYLNMGGNVKAIGQKPDKTSFSAGVQDPKGIGYVKAVDISDLSLVTSGDYIRYYEIDGKKYNHIIAKNTLSPATLYASVTILCPDSFTADMLSTAIFCMPYEKGVEVLKQFENIGAMWIDHDGNIQYYGTISEDVKKAK